VEHVCLGFDNTWNYCLRVYIIIKRVLALLTMNANHELRNSALSYHHKRAKSPGSTKFWIYFLFFSVIDWFFPVIDWCLGVFVATKNQIVIGVIIAWDDFFASSFQSEERYDPSTNLSGGIGNIKSSSSPIRTNW
jgi:hypothetical protein